MFEFDQSVWLVCTQEWRKFIEPFKEQVEDYNFGTLLRLDCKDRYTEENSTFCEHQSLLT